MEDKEGRIEKELLYPYFRKAWRSLEGYLRRERKRLGPMYNQKNMYEEVRRRFGNASREPEKFADEYILIQQKKSGQPSSIRMVIRAIGDLAIDLYMRDRQAEELARQADAERPSGGFIEKKTEGA